MKQLHVAIAMHSGETIVDMYGDRQGTSINMAARVEEKAKKLTKDENCILVTEPVKELTNQNFSVTIEPIKGFYTLKGLSGKHKDKLSQ